MSAIVLLTSRPLPVRQEELPVSFAAPANDAALRRIGAVFGPESELEVSFVGLTAEETRKALALFPGGRRYVLQDN